MPFASGYAITIGSLMLIQWLFFLLSGGVPELRTEPIRISFHLVGEFLTAVLLILAGVQVRGKKLSYRHLLLVAYGMLFYTVIVSPGYFAQREQWGFAAMFGVILLLAIKSVYRMIREW